MANRSTSSCAPMPSTFQDPCLLLPEACAPRNLCRWRVHTGKENTHPQNPSCTASRMSVPQHASVGVPVAMPPHSAIFSSRWLSILRSSHPRSLGRLCQTVECFDQKIECIGVFQQHFQTPGPEDPRGDDFKLDNRIFRSNVTGSSDSVWAVLSLGIRLGCLLTCCFRGMCSTGPFPNLSKRSHNSALPTPG